MVSKASLMNWNLKPHDDFFINLISVIRKRIIENNDDFTLMCVGETGTGKSTLMFHGYKLYDEENMNLDVIGFDTESNARALLNAPKQKGLRFVGNDEANISRRNAMTKYNKEFIDLMFSIRGLNIFHWWNNPSLDVIDKVLIQEKINGLIFITSKEKKLPRTYYYFDKKALLSIPEDNKDKVTLKILRKAAKKKATYKGWFRAYEGELWEQYLKLKDLRMETKLNAFHEKFATVKLTTYGKLATSLGYSVDRLRYIFKKMRDNNELKEGQDFITQPGGLVKPLEAAAETIRAKTPLHPTKRPDFRKFTRKIQEKSL